MSRRPVARAAPVPVPDRLFVSWCTTCGRAQVAGRTRREAEVWSCSFCPCRKGKVVIVRVRVERRLPRDLGTCAWERNGVPGSCSSAAAIRYSDGRKTLVAVCAKHEGWARRQVDTNATRSAS